MPRVAEATDPPRGGARLPARLAGLLLAGIAVTGAAPAAAADPWPARPIRIILPSPPGGGTDAVARHLAQKLGEATGQPCIVEHRPGGSGTVGAAQVARAAPDGSTLLLSTSTHLINALVLKQVPYDAVADFAPVSQIAEVPLVAFVHPSMPVHSLRDLAETRGGAGWSWAIAAIGSPDHLVAESMRSALGLQLQIVPYRGMGPAIADVLGAQVTGTSTSVLPVIAHLREGRLRAIAVTGSRRIPALPAVPTLAESGMSGFALLSWYGLWGPRGLPAATGAALAAAVRRAFGDPDTRVRFPPESFAVVASGPEEFARFIEAEYARYARIVQAAGISVDRL